MKKLLRFAIIFIITYSGGCAFLAISQDSLLYHPDKNQEKPILYGFKAEEISHISGDGTKLLSWYKPPQNDSMPIFIFFHGNAGNLGNRAVDFTILSNNGIGVFALGYRGFGKSEGNPSEQGLYIDARAAIKFVQSQGIADDRIVLYGESLGTGVAMQMAVEYDIAAVILESPYTSMVNAGQYHYPFVPVNLLLRDKYDSINKVDKIAEPVLILHGTDDKIVPYEQGVELYEALKKTAQGTTVRKMVTFNGKGHNNHDLMESFAEWFKFIDSFKDGEQYH